MVSSNPVSTKSEHLSAGHFQFISVHNPDDAKDRAARRLAHSHAVKQALERKRKLEQKSNNNFRVTTWKDKFSKTGVKKRHRKISNAVVPLFSLSTAVLDPFQTLPVNPPRLQTLLHDYKAMQAVEPVFTVAKDLAFQNFHAVFRTGLVDPALVNAVMLSLAFASTGGSIDGECLDYQGQAITYIREKMSFPDLATSESTIGAILLLAGVEARLGMTSQVQLHMGAVQQLLELCQAGNVHLTGGIKRAIFWQDLNSSILTGSRRIIDHTTFPELKWTRDQFPSFFFQLPPGFQKRAHLFSKEFIEVLEDLHVLQILRDVPIFSKSDVKMMENINNHTASMQSRLVDLPNNSHAVKSCHLAAYLSSVMLCCTIWCALVIPSNVSSQLLHELQQANNDPVWDKNPDLLLWLLCIGGAFSPPGLVRTGYINLIRSNSIARFGGRYRSWPELLDILKHFIWSDKAFMPYVKILWEETLA